MTVKVFIASADKPPTCALIMAEAVRSTIPTKLEWGSKTAFEVSDDKVFSNDHTVSRYLARSAPSHALYGTTILERTEIDHWLTFSSGPLQCERDFQKAVLYLDNILAPSTYLVGNKVSLADFAVWGVLHGNPNWKAVEPSPPTNVARWYNFIESLECVSSVKKILPENKAKKAITAEPVLSGRKEEGKFVELPGAEMGKVVVRFPPEASGYLHIGHAKAALLNQYYQENFKGKLIMRFDDTNPAKEKADFEKVILEDLKLLQVKPDVFTHTSDYFDLMLEMCEKLLKEGKAYVDDTEPEQMKLEREQKIESKNRNNSVEQNLKMWTEMKQGTEFGQKCCVRAKIDMNSVIGCMRDPTIYRCKNEPHPKTGTKYKVYPTYDFACPIVDSIEGVTHCLRTTEYHDRDEQFYWFIDVLGLRKPYIWEYSRLNMTNTVLSKRKLAWFVESGLVDGWDDPRFPTVRGILRHGMTVEGLKQFIVAQGSSRSVVLMEWDKIWAINKKVIDPIAPRYTAVLSEGAVNVKVNGVIEAPLIAQKHPKNPDVGSKTVWTGPNLLIDSEDVNLLKEGENATFINWGNLMIKKINSTNGEITVEAEPNIENKDYKKTPKLTWLAVTSKAPFVPCTCVYFDHIISKAILGKDEDFKDYINHQTKTEVHLLGDPELASVKKGDIIQLQRKGFFICDRPYRPPSVYTSVAGPIILFHIPDGHTKDMPTVGKPKSSKVDTKKEFGNKESRSTQQQEAGRDLKSGSTPYSLSFKVESVYAVGSDAKVALLQKIDSQEKLVSKLKEENASEETIEKEVKALLTLRSETKALTGERLKIDFDPPKITEEEQEKPPNQVKDTSITDELLLKISAQGDTVRKLKQEKAAKNIIDTEVKKLLDLKAQFKSVTGEDWRVDLVPKVKKELELPSLNTSIDVRNDLLEKIASQGLTVRKLKSEKADKVVIDAEVKKLLDLKAEFKSVTGEDWRTELASKDHSIAKDTSAGSVAPDVRNNLLKAISEQGDVVRKLKSEKAPNSAIDTEVKKLLDLKAEFKAVTGEDWKVELAPKNNISPSAGAVAPDTRINLLKAISEQGDIVRKLKSEKASKSTVDAEVKKLLDLKAEFKTITGEDWKADLYSKDTAPKMPTAGAGEDTAAISTLTQEITDQGNKVRNLKSTGAPKVTVDAEVARLLSLKAEYKQITGKEFPSAGAKQATKKEPKEERKEKQKKEVKEKQTAIKKEPEVKDGEQVGLKKQTRLGLEARKEENLPDWYSQVITKGELIEYYDVSGCYVLRPWSFAVWERIKDYFDCEIKKLGVQNCYFPLFVSRGALEKEKSHIADFSPEVAWITKSGDTDLAEPIAVRPTSETVMYPSYAKWIQSYRDLPLKLNQWNNVVRWEFKHPQPFLRTREFLWQEGHTAFATFEEAREEVKTMLDLYANIYTDLLAIPVIKGRKTQKEKFAGGDYTLTVEAFISASGRAIQGATSHHLGQNFSKMFEIVFEDPETQEKKFVYQNSWGITTRTIGVMIMIHGDNQGLVLPPRVASIQVVIVPCGITVNMKDEERNELISSCRQLEQQLKDKGVRAHGDYRDNYSPGWRFNHWELKGVPIRVEIGPKDLKQKQIIAVRRDNGEKIPIPRDSAVSELQQLLETIHHSLFNKAKNDLDQHTKLTKKWTEFCQIVDQKNIVLAPFCGEVECEDNIKKDSARDDADAEPGALAMGAKGLCIPFDQPDTLEPNDKCIHPACNRTPLFYSLFGRSY
ncbi:bifunctional glutamate/proline--tRNA ligase [Schistocerca americana]|uniref:bifunctional glutamate/proline--tRNA ligase n=1 Tax=Schistocerca americana TaxID=7009 RepID=UPI001F4F3BD9|nr:bifunctional glutamate/proline--tRNA ligase [Schistocerca americana]